MKVRPIPFSAFVSNSNAEALEPLPLVHSTSSHRIFDIFEQERLIAAPCNIFRGDNLCYLFVGRPAYKSDPVANPSFWQLPTVFVLRFDRAMTFKRVFPFDSGAFSRRLLPDFITCFKLDGYDVSGDIDNVGRIVSIFYGSSQKYLRRQAADEESFGERYALSPQHQEVAALARLYRTQLTPECDDRSSAIEVQVAGDIVLTAENVLGIVMPREYARVAELVGSIAHITECIETYDLYPLSLDQHYASIYDAVARIYRRASLG